MTGPSSIRWTKRLAWRLSDLSRLAFGVTFLLAMMTPAWETGTFTHLPVAEMRIGGQRFSLGALALLPVLGSLSWVAGRLLNPRDLPLRWGPAHIAVPMFGLALLTAVRIWPIHVTHIAVIVGVAVIVFLGTYLYVLQDWSEETGLLLIALFVVLQGTVAILQFARQDSVGLAWLGESALDPTGKGISVIEAGGRRWLRAYGLTPHPNVLGGYLGMGTLICLGGLRKPWVRWRMGLIVASLLGGLGLFVTFSRSAWLATAVGMIYLLAIVRPWRKVEWRTPRNKRYLLYLVLLVLGIALGTVLLFGDLLATRFLRLRSPLEASSIQERLVDYGQAWSLIRTVPIKGVGAGYYIPALWAGVGEDRPPGFRRVHSTPLLVCAELGMGGLVLWLWLLLAPPLALARSWKRVPNREGASWAAAFLCAAVLGLFDSYLYVPSTWWPALFVGFMSGTWARSVLSAQEQLP